MISKKCPFCDKEVKGWNEKMLDYNMQTHIRARHPDKLKFEIGEKVSEETK